MAKKKKNKIGSWIFIGIVFGLVVYGLTQFLNKIQKLDRVSYQEKKTRSKLSPTLKPLAAHKDKVAILIDDLGVDMKAYQTLKGMNARFSCAILPFQPYSEKIAKDAQFNHFDVLLHLPMESEGEVNPGKGAIYHTMTKDAILNQIRSDLHAFPYIQGVNNHMGSKITSDSGEMEIILNEVKSQNLFFVDSRTTAETVAYHIAREIGIKSAERQIFLDDDEHLERIKEQLNRLIKLSHQHGTAIAIGHPRKNTLKALKTFLPRLDQEGIEVVPVSTLVR
ncbi:MAG: divergent polysaccharide deacetylase family protein [Nitrospiria bacterium]